MPITSRRALRRLAYRRRSRRPGRARLYRRIGYSGAIKQTHAYKRYTWDYTIANTYSGGASGIVLNVDGVNQGSNYLGVRIGNLQSSVNGTSGFGGSIDFRMNMLPGLNDFATLYDKYKLTGVKVKIIPLSNFASASNLGTLPMITAAVDQDDNTIPVDDIVLREYGNCKVKRLVNGFSIFVKPKQVATIADAIGADQTAVVQTPKYIDFNQTDIPHFGLKWYMDNVLLGNTTNVNALFKITMQYYFKCSMVR